MNVITSTKYGTMVVSDNDTGMGANLIAYGEVHNAEIEFLKQLCAPGNVVFDCGANIGNHSLIFAKSVGENGSVFSFEPQENCFQLLCANLAINNLFNVQVFKCAVGDNNKDLLFPFVSPNMKFNFGGISMKESHIYTKSVKVQQRQLDEFLDIEKCDLLKIDVEGFESAVLNGGLNFISKFRPVIYCENNRVEQFDELVYFFEKNNYVAYSHLPPSFNINNFRGDKNNYFHGNYKEPNLVALPYEKQHLMSQSFHVEKLQFHVPSF